jgi:hypothetical protein
MDKESIVKAEYAAAKQEGRQPRCPYCQAVLGVRQVSRRETYWRWDGERFEKRTSDEVDEPYCVNCQALDWNFIDNDLVKFCDPLPLFTLTEEDVQDAPAKSGEFVSNRNTVVSSGVMVVLHRPVHITTKYIVNWTQHHRTEIDSDNPDDACKVAARYASEDDTCVSSDSYRVMDAVARPTGEVVIASSRVVMKDVD